MTATTFHVSNAAQLAAVLKLATGGETINLDPGNYGNLSFYKFAPTAMVTIQAGASFSTGVLAAVKPIFSNILVNQSSNLTFNGLEVTALLPPGANKTTALVTSYNSNHLNFTNLDLHGTPNHNPLGDISGIHISGGHDIQIANSSFHDLYNAVGVLSVSALAVTNNTVTEVREGFDFGGLHHALIDHNLITSVIPDYALDPTINPATGEHPDMIQFWTSNVGGSDDVTISNNALLLGKGMDTHGIFISTQNTSVFSNFLIDNNLVSTNNGNGISVYGMDGGIIHHNTVLTTGSVYTAILGVYDSNSVQVLDNISTYYGVSNSTNVVSTGNIKTHVGGAMDATNVLNMFTNPLKPGTTSVSDFTEVTGGLAATSGAGFDMTAYNAKVPFATYDALVHSLDVGGFLHHIA